MDWTNVNTQPLKFTASTLEWSDPIQAGLAGVDACMRQISEGQHDSLTAATESLLNAGGKRVRPALCLLTAGIFSADFNRSVSLAAGVELLHTATLVHDDLIDGALLRRGMPTLNADWSPDASVLVGDYLFARAANLVAQSRNIHIMELFAQTLMVILNGEIAQRFSKWQIDRQEYYKRIYAKTAALFVLSIQAAASLGEADEDSMEALVSFGHSIGMAFQIVDDILDFVSTAEQIGKPTGSDLRQGLFTLPAIYYSEANHHDLDLEVLLKAKDGNHPLIPKVITKVRKSGAIESSLEEARELVRQGQRTLERLPYSIYVASLSAMAESVVERKM